MRKKNPNAWRIKNLQGSNTQKVYLNLSSMSSTFTVLLLMPDLKMLRYCRVKTLRLSARSDCRQHDSREWLVLPSVGQNPTFFGNFWVCTVSNDLWVNCLFLTKQVYILQLESISGCVFDGCILTHKAGSGQSEELA